MPYDPEYPCAGCGGEWSTERPTVPLYFDHPLGLTCRWVHRARECAEAVRDTMPPGTKWVKPPKTRRSKLDE